MVIENAKISLFILFLKEYAIVEERIVKNADYEHEKETLLHLIKHQSHIVSRLSLHYSSQKEKKH